MRKLFVALVAFALLVGMAPSGGAADRGDIDLVPGDSLVRQEAGFESGRHPGPVMLSALHSPAACSGAFGFYCDTFRISTSDVDFMAILTLTLDSSPDDNLTMYLYAEDGWTARPLNSSTGTDPHPEFKLGVGEGEILWLVVLNWATTPSQPYALTASLTQAQ